MNDYDWIGWMATSLFSISYFCRKQLHLLICQAVAATVWLIYGAMIGKPPIVVANVIVALSAGLSAFRLSRRQKSA